MARYQRDSDWVTNTWRDNETGESFAESDTPAWRRLQEWIAEGNTPDTTPFAVTVAPKPEDSRPGKIAKLAAQAKQGLADPSISTPGEKRMATIFGQALDALAALDPLPPAPVVVTGVIAPDQPPAPPRVRNAGRKPVLLQ
jgi:hypothetical protein